MTLNTRPADYESAALQLSYSSLFSLAHSKPVSAATRNILSQKPLLNRSGFFLAFRVDLKKQRLNVCFAVGFVAQYGKVHSKADSTRKTRSMHSPAALLRMGTIGLQRVLKVSCAFAARTTQRWKEKGQMQYTGSQQRFWAYFSRTKRSGLAAAPMPLQAQESCTAQRACP